MTAKILAIVFPVTAFVARGFEHSIANMYFIPIGILAALESGLAVPASLGLGGFLTNLIPVTIGNIVGGGVLVALTYYVVYLRARELNARPFAGISRAPIIRGAAKAQKYKAETGRTFS